MSGRDEALTEVVQSTGGCGAISPSGEWACVLERGHGPHGWSAPSVPTPDELGLLTRHAYDAGVEAAINAEDAGRSPALQVMAGIDAALRCLFANGLIGAVPSEKWPAYVEWPKPWPND